MNKTAEYVSIGHPDKVADYISSFILDQYLNKDPDTKYAVEVMIKDNTVILGGEVKSKVGWEDCVLRAFVIKALAEIGYTQDYANVWEEKAIEPSKIEVINLIGQQSAQINQGLDGWGDQGVFVGYYNNDTSSGLPLELEIAKGLGQELYNIAKNDAVLGLDIKTQITLSDDESVIDKCVVAIPLLTEECNRGKEAAIEDIKGYVYNYLGKRFVKEIIINGTGEYIQHSSIADCGITGRKLAVDFYSTASAIGGGSPWTKDPSKADVTLNILANTVARDVATTTPYAKEVFVYLSSCIGRKELCNADVKIITKDGGEEWTKSDIVANPSQIIETLGLKAPVWASKCMVGLFE